MAIPIHNLFIIGITLELAIVVDIVSMIRSIKIKIQVYYLIGMIFL